MYKFQMSSRVEVTMTKFYVTVDGKEYLETFVPDAECVFCEVKGAYKLGKGAISFCEIVLFGG